MIPYRIDLYAILILLGAVQGFFLSYFFLATQQNKRIANLFLGCFILSLSFMISEVFLCYTAYIQDVIYLIDLAEPLNFMVAPLFFLYFRSRLFGAPGKHYWLHFIPFILYCCYAPFYILQGDAFKYNSFIDAYHPEAQFLPYEFVFSDDPLKIRSVVNELTIVQLFVYLFLTSYYFFKHFKQSKPELRDSKLGFLKGFFLSYLIGVLMFLIVKLIFENDLGDYLLGSFTAFTLYMISFSLIKNSSFFVEGTYMEVEKEKYSKSGLTVLRKNEILASLNELLTTDKIFMDPLVSLPLLSKKIGVSPNHLSQVINEELKQSFFELISQYRVNEACEILGTNKGQQMKIDELAETVGYNSKSAFITTFKKLTGKTPAVYRNSAK